MIELNKSDGIWTATINRPDKANSLTLEMLNRLTEIAKDARAARGLVLTGNGKVFSAGADLVEAQAGLAVDPVWEELSGAIASLPCLTVAALNGTLAGGAMGMALACDIRLCTPSAKFFYPVMKLGFLPQPSDPGRMRNLIGPARTKLVLMGGQKLEAEEALSFGLVDRVHAADDLLPAAYSLMTDSAAADPDLTGKIKDMCAS